MSFIWTIYLGVNGTDRVVDVKRHETILVKTSSDGCGQLEEVVEVMHRNLRLYCSLCDLMNK